MWKAKASRRSSALSTFDLTAAVITWARACMHARTQTIARGTNTRAIWYALTFVSLLAGELNYNKTRFLESLSVSRLFHFCREGCS